MPRNVKCSRENWDDGISTQTPLLKLSLFCQQKALLPRTDCGALSFFRCNFLFKGKQASVTVLLVVVLMIYVCNMYQWINSSNFFNSYYLLFNTTYVSIFYEVIEYILCTIFIKISFRIKLLGIAFRIKQLGTLLSITRTHCTIKGEFI